jgi:hypothetical protein
MSQVKAYIIKQWDKIQQGSEHVSLKDFIFSKEVKLGT